MSKEAAMSTPAVRVQERGQVTIPKDIREELGLEKGDLVTFVETEEGYLLKPAEVVMSAALDEIGRALKERGMSIEELMERGREIRGELIEQEYDVPAPEDE
jgi:AbrB family looped-hinge helix DNA binding protein